MSPARSSHAGQHGCALARGAGLLVACLLAACSTGEEVFTEQDLELIRSMALVELPQDPSNEFARNDAVARLGQALFFDRDLGGPRTDGTRGSCAECHAPSHWFSDPRTPNNVSRGIGWTTRNSPALVNVGYYRVFGWSGGSDSLWAQGHHAYTGAATMGGTPLHLAKTIAARYRNEYLAAFQTPLLDFNQPRFSFTPLDSMSAFEVDLVYQRALKAWSAYLLRLVSMNSPFDRFALGDRDALTPAQQRGLQLFLGKAGCITCHSGPAFTDQGFHALGVAQAGVNVPTEDLGHYAGLQTLAKLPYRLKPPPMPTEADRGAFRTKGLRQVAETAPYFHAGQARSLVDVVWFYNQGGDRAGAGAVSPLLVPLALSEAEQADLVEFLGALTGQPVLSSWRCDTSATRNQPDALATPCTVP